MTDKMISCCGMFCADCLAYIATKTDDQEFKANTAKQLSALGYRFLLSMLFVTAA